MANLTGKGYGNRGSVFTFKVNGKVEVYTSNACREQDLRAKLGIESAEDMTASSFYLSDGKHKKDTYVDFIWVAKGSSISGKNAIEHLLKIGAITEEQATAILNANTATL